MMFKVANYELRVNPNKQTENIFVYITNMVYDYYVDIFSTDNIPLSKKDKNKITELRQWLARCRDGKTAVCDLIKVINVD